MSGSGRPGAGDRPRMWILIGVAAVFVGSIFWSIISETLLPLYRAGDTPGLLYNLVGIPVVLTGTSLIVWGGFVFLRGMFSAFSDETLQQNLEVVRGQVQKDAVAVSQARRENFLILARAMRPGVSWMLGGFLLIALGGFLINLRG
jgi:hypothetical protein